MQALAGSVRQLGQFLEANGRIDEISEDDARCFWLIFQEQCGCLIEQRLGKAWVSFNPGQHGLLEFTGQCHRLHSFRLPALWCANAADFRVLY